MRQYDSPYGPHGPIRRRRIHPSWPIETQQAGGPLPLPTSRLPPLLAAAIAWDAWHTLAPEQQGSWRAPLLAALVLRARAKTRQFLLPIGTGQWLLRKSWKAGAPYAPRILEFLDIVAAAVKVS